VSSGSTVLALGAQHLTVKRSYNSKYYTGFWTWKGKNRCWTGESEKPYLQFLCTFTIKHLKKERENS